MADVTKKIPVLQLEIFDCLSNKINLRDAKFRYELVLALLHTSREEDNRSILQGIELVREKNGDVYDFMHFNEDCM